MQDGFFLVPKLGCLGWNNSIFHAQGICKEVTSPHAQLAQQSLEPWQPPTPANNNSIISDPTSPTLPPAWSIKDDTIGYKEMQQ